MTICIPVLSRREATSLPDGVSCSISERGISVTDPWIRIMSNGPASVNLPKSFAAATEIFLYPRELKACRSAALYRHTIR
jgi:hypothetical protein